MSRPVEVIHGVFRLPLGIFGRVSNGYIWISDDGPVVLDAGPPRAGTTIIDAIVALDYRPQDVVALLVTHGDFDHVGGLAAVKHWCDAPVVAPEAEVPLIEGGVGHHTRLQTSSAVGRALAQVMGAAIRLIGTPEPVTVDIELTQESDTTPGGLRPIPTPGHTAGHTSYFALQPGVLFAGDALRNMSELSTPPARATEDMDKARKSIKQLTMLSFDVACFGHGPPITKNADEKIRGFAESLSD